MIHIIKGDLLEAREHIIAHQVNCQGVMGSGVAKQIKDRYPIAFKEYSELVKEKRDLGEDLEASLLGQVQGVSIGSGLYIANMFGQLTYGKDNKQYTNTFALYSCFKKVREIAEENSMSVAMPYMVGCYRGGADWKEVENFLLIAFEGYDVTLYKL